MTSAYRQVDDAILELVKSKIGKKWLELGRRLKITVAKLDSIDVQYKHYGLDEMCYQMLCVWRQANGAEATVAVLMAELEAIGRQDVADEIMKKRQILRDGTHHCTNRRGKEDHTRRAAGSQYPLVAHEELSEPEWLEWLASKLHDKYQKYVMKGLPWMGNVKISLADYYVDLSLQISDRNKKTTQGNRIGREELQEQNNSLQQQNSNKEEESADSSKQLKSEHISEIFQSVFSASQYPLRILVEGPPGYGKTTLSAKLCFDHLTPENYIKNFDLVLHFTLRSFEGNLEEMLCRAADLSDYNDREMLLKILNNPSNRILLVLDGFDEIPQQHVQTIYSFLNGERFPHVAIVITSRSGAITFESWETGTGCAEQRELTQDWTRIFQSKITILGISKQMKAVFIEKHLLGFPQNLRTEISSQLQQMEDNDIIESEFLECPLFLLMIILLATGEGTGGIHNLRTPTDLYKSIFNFIIRRYCSKQKESINKKVDLFSVTEVPKPFYVDLLYQFGEFAFWALTEDKLSFSQDEILGNDQRKQNILKLGLLTKSVMKLGFMEKVVYEPVHKSLLEFAAVYTLWLQSYTYDRDIWANKVICLWRLHQRIRPFCLLVLAELMQDRVAAVLDALKPYASCRLWDYWHRNRVSEIELTEAFLTSLTPFLPIHWTQWDRDYFSRTQHDALLFYGIREGRIKHVTLSDFLATPMPEDVEVDTAEFRNIEDTRVNVHAFRCKHIVFRDSSILQSMETDVSSIINFQTISFVFKWKVLSQLRLLRSAITDGVLKAIPIRFIKCEITQNAALGLLEEVIKMEKLNSLEISCRFQLPFEFQESLNSLLKAAANSSQLTSLLLRNNEGDVTVDLGHFCGRVKKTWEFLSITNCKVEFNQQIGQPIQAKCLVLDLPHISKALFNFLDVRQVTSLKCNLSLLANIGNVKLLCEHLTELNVILDGTVVNAQQCRLPHLPKLIVLMLTMSRNKPCSFPVSDFLFGTSNFPQLKGLEIWEAVCNPELSMEVMKCVCECLKESITVPSTCQGRNKPRTSHSLKLEYVLLNSDDNGLDDCYLETLREVKTLLQHKSLSRFDIVFHRQYYFGFLDTFSPKDRFQVETGVWGTRSEDTILSRMKYDTQSSLKLAASFSQSHKIQMGQQ